MKYILFITTLVILAVAQQLTILYGLVIAIPMWIAFLIFVCWTIALFDKENEKLSKTQEEK